MSESSKEHAPKRVFEITPKLTYEQVYELVYTQGRLNYRTATLGKTIGPVIVANMEDLLRNENIPIGEILKNFTWRGGVVDKQYWGMTAIGYAVAPDFAREAVARQVGLDDPRLVSMSADVLIKSTVFGISNAQTRKAEYESGERIPGNNVSPMQAIEVQQATIVRYQEYQDRIEAIKLEYFENLRGT